MKMLRRLEFVITVTILTPIMFILIWKKTPSIMLYVYTMDFKNIDLNYKEG